MIKRKFFFLQHTRITMCFHLKTNKIKSQIYNSNNTASNITKTNVVRKNREF